MGSANENRDDAQPEHEQAYREGVRIRACGLGRGELWPVHIDRTGFRCDGYSAGLGVIPTSTKCNLSAHRRDEHRDFLYRF